MPVSSNRVVQVVSYILTYETPMNSTVHFLDFVKSCIATIGTCVFDKFADCEPVSKWHLKQSPCV